jgi:hypothetical protein
MHTEGSNRVGDIEHLDRHAAACCLGACRCQAQSGSSSRLAWGTQEPYKKLVFLVELFLLSLGVHAALVKAGVSPHRAPGDCGAFESNGRGCPQVPEPQLQTGLQRLNVIAIYV